MRCTPSKNLYRLVRGVLALSAFSLPLRGREGAGGRGAGKRDNRDFGARGRLISRPTENRICFCIEKVLISVLVFFGKLQGPDLRTFDLSGFFIFVRGWGGRLVEL